MRGDMAQTRKHQARVALTSAAIGTLLLLGQGSGAQAQFPTASSVTSQPTLPVAGVQFKLHVTVLTIGAPVSVSQVSATVLGDRIDVTHCLHQGSSAAAPAAVKYEVPIAPLSEGSYQVVVTQKFIGEDSSPCGRFGILLEAQTEVVASTALRPVIEYYYAPRNHYFQTQDAGEIAALDNGQFVGWARTGQQFSAYAPGSASKSASLLPTCRFYGLPEAGLDTHFFSSMDAECAAIPILFPNQWIEETPDAFGAAQVVSATKSCPIGTLPLYRLYNGLPDVNHRYTTSLAIRQQMIDAGWIPEGYGTLGVALCTEIPI